MVRRSRSYVALSSCLIIALPLVSRSQVQLPPWVASASDYEVATAFGQRLTPNGPIDHPRRRGFVDYSSLVEQGFGTFEITIPKTWPAWAIGLPPDQVIDALHQVDVDWAETFAERLHAANQDKASKLRGLFVAGDRDDLVFVQVTMLGGFDEKSLADWIANPLPLYEETVGGNLEVRAWIEHQTGRSLRIVSSYKDNTHASIDYFLLETNNSIMWSIQCMMPSKFEDAYRAACDAITSTFAAGAYIVK